MATSLAVEDPRAALVGRAGADVLGGRYELLDRVGRGGMSVVWRARDAVTGRLVAVKILDEAYGEDRVLQQRIGHEAQIAAAVSSPYVVRAFDHGEHECGNYRLPFVVMEFVDGITLQERLNAGPVPPDVAMNIGAQVASALAAVHAAGVVHCDVKPANIMLTGDRTKVVDFGIAVHAESEDTLNQPFHVVGTPAYMAPERFSGSVARPSADVFALGVVLYRLLAGVSPWSAEGTLPMLVTQASEEPAPMPPRVGIPAFVTTLAGRCLAKDPAVRPSAAEVELVLTRGSLMSAGPDLPTTEYGGAGAPRNGSRHAARTCSTRTHLRTAARTVSSCCPVNLEINGLVGDLGPTSAPVERARLRWVARP